MSDGRRGASDASCSGPATITCVFFPIAGYFVSSEWWQASCIFGSACCYSWAVWKYAEKPRRNPLEIIGKKGADGSSEVAPSVLVAGVAAAILVIVATAWA